MGYNRIAMLEKGKAGFFRNSFKYIPFFKNKYNYKRSLTNHNINNNNTKLILKFQHSCSIYMYWYADSSIFNCFDHTLRLNTSIFIFKHAQIK